MLSHESWYSQIEAVTRSIEKHTDSPDMCLVRSVLSYLSEINNQPVDEDLIKQMVLMRVEQLAAPIPAKQQESVRSTAILQQLEEFVAKAIRLVGIDLQRRQLEVFEVAILSLQQLKATLQKLPNGGIIHFNPHAAHVIYDAAADRIIDVSDGLKKADYVQDVFTKHQPKGYDGELVGVKLLSITSPSLL